MMLADLAKHIVKAHTLQDRHMAAGDFLKRLRRDFETEMDSQPDEAIGNIVD